MINIVFDLSNMFHRSMFVVGGYGKKGFTFDTQNEIDQLMRKVATDVAFTLRQVRASRVFFAADSKSWRKKIEIEENEGYKGSREEKKSSTINWTNVYNLMDEFCAIMDKKGLISTKIKGAEADDIMCLWRDKLLFDKNEHVVLVSGDEDIRQLVFYNSYESGKKAFCTIFNPFTQGKNAKKKLFVGNFFKEWLTSDDGIGSIFNRGSDTDKESFTQLINENSVELEEIDGNEIAMRKIFCGDDGDEIPALYTWMGVTQKGDPVQRRITPSVYSKIMEYLKPISLETNNSRIIDHVDLPSLELPIEIKLTEISGHKPNINISERINRQIKLVVLSKEVFPEEIVEEFDSLSDNELSKVPDQINGWYLNTLLEGTRYVVEGFQKAKNEASIFKEIDRISQSLF